jgi:release factor glutamine methyltransferase
LEAEKIKMHLYGLNLTIPRDVYKPAEDTFLLAENLRLNGREEVLEIGCGCGILSLLAARKAKRVVAVDINPSAVKATEANASANNLKEKIEARCGNLFEPLKLRKEKFDLIIFNPPYLPGETGKDYLVEAAWIGGKKGREILDKFLAGVKTWLKPDGRIIFVQSSITGLKETIRKLKTQGFRVRILAVEKLFFETLFCIEGLNRKS